MSALLTWQESPGTYPAPAAATEAAYMAALLNALTSWGGEANSRWQVCSSDLVGNPTYITLKRKNGDPGRILFLRPTANITLQAPLGHGYVSTTGSLTRAYFPEATSDTPVNFTGGGAIFTNQGRCTGITGNGTQTLNTTMLFKVYDCEDGVIVVQSNPGAYTGMVSFAGDLIEDRDGNAQPIAGHDTSAVGLAYQITPQAIASNTPFYISADATGKFAMHVSVQYNTSFGASYKDVSNGEAWFIPIILGHPSRPYAKMHSFKFRQMAYGPSTTIASEKLYVSGPILVARNANFSSGGNMFWLTEFFV